MVGERLRQARMVAGLTQKQVVSALAELDVSLTKAGLSKYELGGSDPPVTLLLKFAKVLGVRSNYFTRKRTVSIEWLAYRKRANFGKKHQERIQATVTGVVEAQVWLQEALHPGRENPLPRPSEVRTAADAERAAAKLRSAWGLDDLPVDSMTAMFEDHGGIVVLCGEEEGKLDGLSGWANGKYPIAVVSGVVPDDRRRFSLAHELGHLTMERKGLSAKAEEGLAHRFAGAFIVPPAVARYELGERRRSLSFGELKLLKRKHGLSMQAWVRRAYDLGIISEGQYRTLNKTIRGLRWHKHEPVDYVGAERPTKLRQMTLRALAEGIITPDRAEATCPGCTKILEEDTAGRPNGYVSAREIMKLSKADRERIFAASAAAAAEAYAADPDLTDTEAFGEEEFYDDPS